MAKLNMDLSGVKAEENFKVVPVGTYDLVVDDAVIKSTKSKTGFYINFKYKVISEECKGAVIYDIVNIKNDSPKAVEIGQERLKRMLELHGMPVDGSADTDEFKGKTFSAYIVVDKQEGYSDSNKIKSLDKSAAEFKAEKTDGNVPSSWT